MVSFIAQSISMKAKNSIESGKDQYRAYFVKTKLYLQFKNEVDAILIMDGYGDVIVSS